MSGRESSKRVSTIDLYASCFSWFATQRHFGFAVTQSELKLNDYFFGVYLRVHGEMVRFVLFY